MKVVGADRFSAGGAPAGGAGRGRVPRAGFIDTECGATTPEFLVITAVALMMGLTAASLVTHSGSMTAGNVSHEVRTVAGAEATTAAATGPYSSSEARSDPGAGRNGQSAGGRAAGGGMSGGGSAGGVHLSGATMRAESVAGADMSAANSGSVAGGERLAGSANGSGGDSCRDGGTDGGTDGGGDC